MNLSNPPYYTACPNPWIADFISEWEGQKPDHPEGYNYHREPFAADVSEGKNDPVYRAHSYHTKVPYRAIQRYVEHFTEPGDIIADMFCGTGMTALAASSLGRKSIVYDLSPYASFIADNYCRSIPAAQLRSIWENVLSNVEQEIGWVYQCREGVSTGTMHYTVWSDVYFCPSCSEELVFWDIFVDNNEKIRDELKCPNCSVLFDKSELSQARSAEGEVKRTMVKIYETRNGRKHTRKPNSADLLLVSRCQDALKDIEVPTELMLFKGGRFGDMYVPRQHTGINQVNNL